VRCSLPFAALFLVVGCGSPPGPVPTRPPTPISPADATATLEKLGITRVTPQEIDIGGFGRYARQHPAHFADDDVNLLEAFPGLEKLSIRNCQITD
jgi:hypothetical protein